ncbi:MAG: hypothetical protein JNM53_12035, partial [Gemmatimonadetes bacterium]|nr:hypothetical protein [Gemmatimonadota bacterium]
YAERTYHDLVDMPFFVGRFDLDSATVDGLNVRLATYPAGTLAGDARAAFWAQYRKLFAPQVQVFGERPYSSYTTMMVFPPEFGGGSALEHQNSHVGIYTPEGIGQPWIASVTAHEMFHAFNVKRLRPAEMVPYRYDVAQPTVWLWVSEGITDYYADLTMLRGGVIDSAAFLEETGNKIAQVNQVPAVALEDASLSTWIHPTDGTGYIYYPKGSLAGLLLDILIRDASDNRRSLDDVMRETYQRTYKQGKGFGATEWWGAVSRAAGAGSSTASMSATSTAANRSPTTACCPWPACGWSPTACGCRGSASTPPRTPPAPWSPPSIRTGRPPRPGSRRGTGSWPSGRFRSRGSRRSCGSAPSTAAARARSFRSRCGAASRS